MLNVNFSPQHALAAPTKSTPKSISGTEKLPSLKNTAESNISS